MKALFLILALIMSLPLFANDRCNADGVERLFNGQNIPFFSKADADQCLKQAVNGGVPGVSVKAVDGKTYVFSYGKNYQRALKLNGKDSFLKKDLFSKQYRINDTVTDGNRTRMKAKFVFQGCTEVTKETCAQQNMNFDQDFCQCVAKEKRFCGEKKLTLEKKDSLKAKCDEDKGEIWDDENCSCSDQLFCGDKQWNLSKLMNEQQKCEKKDNHNWNDETCSCDPDASSFGTCGGKKVLLVDLKNQEQKCLEKNNGSHPGHSYSWDLEACECKKEKVVVSCGGEEISQQALDRKRESCERKIERNPLYFWDEEHCQCDKHEKLKEEDPLCGGKKMSQKRIDRKKARCERISGTWDQATCECEDPCYEVEEREEVEVDECTETEDLKLGDIKVSAIADATCQNILSDAEKEKVQEACKEQLKAELGNLEEGKQNISLQIQYTSSNKVLCGEKIQKPEAAKSIDRPLPSNVPTTDPKMFSGDCNGTDGAKITGPMAIYRPKGKISCSEMESIKKSYEDITGTAKDALDMFFQNIQGPITKEAMDDLLKKTTFKLDVLGTANRTNNGTGRTLNDLAEKRKSEAERIMKEEIVKQIETKVGGGYKVPDQLKGSIFKPVGLSRPIGPLNPTNSTDSLLKVLNEKEVPPELGACKNKQPLTTKTLYDCSVNFFIDKECPQLKSTSPRLFEKFCSGDLEKRRKELLGMTDAKFLRDFKMFDVGVQIEGPASSQFEYKEGQNTIKVDCSANVEGGKETVEQTTSVKKILKVTKPGFFRRLKKDCREERKKLNEEYGRKNVRKAANKRKNPDGIVLPQ